MKKLLKSITKYTSYRFVEIKQRIPYHVSTGKKIDPNHIVTSMKRPKDGFYSLLKCICGGKQGCKIGKPASYCVTRGIAIPGHCGRYLFYADEKIEEIEHLKVSMKELKNIVNANRQKKKKGKHFYYKTFSSREEVKK